MEGPHFWKREKSVAPTGIGTPDRPENSLVPTPACRQLHFKIGKLFVSKNGEIRNVANAVTQETNVCYSVGRTRLITLRRLTSYIYGAPILDVSRSHTTTQHSR